MVTSPVRYTLLSENNTHCIPTHWKCDLHRWPTRITYHAYDFDARTYLQNTRYASTITLRFTRRNPLCKHHFRQTGTLCILPPFLCFRNNRHTVLFELLTSKMENEVRTTHSAYMINIKHNIHHTNKNKNF